MKTPATDKSFARRGPAEHAVRDQIIAAARDYFTHYGYDKTTVADLAREIGFSKAYIYRFFESKQAIGQAICNDRLTLLFDQVRAAVDDGADPIDKLRKFSKTVANASVEMFFTDRKLYEIAAHASLEKWSSAQAYHQRLEQLLEAILKEGRESGVFERKTPLDEIRRSIFYSLRQFIDPMLLQHSLDILPDAENEVMGLVLRSLAP